MSYAFTVVGFVTSNRAASDHNAFNDRNEITSQSFRSSVNASHTRIRYVVLMWWCHAASFGFWVINSDTRSRIQTPRLLSAFRRVRSAARLYLHRGHVTVKKKSRLREWRHDAVDDVIGISDRWLMVLQPFTVKISSYRSVVWLRSILKKSHF